jgi:hypothetical protein
VSGEFFRPGPASLSPGCAPDGIVFHVYTTDGRLLIETRLVPGIDPEIAGQLDAATIDGMAPVDIVWVAYDGDSGERWTERDWAGFTGTPGVWSQARSAPPPP